MEKYDLVIIGGGPGGYVAAIRAAQLKMNVALIEKDQKLGGTCLNVGCIPSKVLLEATEYYHKAIKKMKKVGLSFENIKIDKEQLIKRKENVINELSTGIDFLMKKNGIRIFKGKGKILNQNEILIENEKSEKISTSKILIATGSLPLELPFLKFDHTYIIDSTDALTLEKIPEKMAIIGAGAIGLEMGAIYSRLGTKVVFIEIMPNIAPFCDEQISKSLQRYLQEDGMEFKLNSKLVDAQIVNQKVRLKIENGKEEEIECDKVLVSIGRGPNTKDQGFETVGIRMNERGFIIVDENFKTSLENVYAIGDVIFKGPMLAHKASSEGIACIEKINGIKNDIDYNAIPNVIYTTPEVAQVGLTEKQAQELGLRYKIGKTFFKANGRAKSCLEDEGLIKIIVNEESNTLIGMHILGPKASELVHIGAIAIQNKLKIENMIRTTFAHPTLIEAIKEAIMSAEKRAIH